MIRKILPPYLVPLIPEYRLFLRQMTGMLSFTLLLKWLPAIWSWGYFQLHGKVMEFSSEKYQVLLYVAYGFCALAFSIGLIGLLALSARAWKNAKQA